MPLYQYKVIDEQGAARDGRLETENEDKLLEKLRGAGYTVIDVREISGEEADGEDVLTRDVGFSLEFGISPKAISFFARQLSITLNAGLPLTRIIATLFNQTSSKNLKKVIYDIGKDIQLGSSLSDSMKKHDDVFDNLFLSMVSVGEASGTLPRSMTELADLMEKERAVKRKLRSAMAYPTFIIAFTLILSYVLIALLMPGFIPVFKSTGLNIEQDYPLTHMLIKASNFVTNPVVVTVTVVVLVLIIIGFNLMKRSKKGSYVIDYVKFNFPFLNKTIRLAAVTRFCRAFATLLNSGVPLLKALNLVGGASGNLVITGTIEKMAKEISEGEKLSKGMKKTRLFPELVVQMVSIGEEAGTLPEMLERTADYFEQELEGSIEAMTSLMEPVMMIVVGIIVGIFVMGILLPILGIASQFGG